MLTAVQIAEQVRQVIREHHEDRPEWNRTKRLYRDDLGELEKFRESHPRHVEAERLEGS